jgi:AraC family transcriptional regulator, regulatory protein of adaptative response / methylated-DNA-[protein]-cysteine methyltransferase
MTMYESLTSEVMERAYLEKDVSFDGVFYVAVRTTRIFCRPVCPARKALPKNVEYFFTAQAALAAGYRPCKRCRPMQPSNCPEWAEMLLKEIEENPLLHISESDLHTRGINPTTVRRYFRQRYKMSFQAYTRKRRLIWALSRLQQGDSLDNVVFASGYKSHSGFRTAFVRVFGMTPKA